MRENNSGKSTLLRLIGDPPARYLGRALNATDADQLCRTYCTDTVFLKNDVFTRLGNHILEIFHEVALSRRTWFAGLGDLAEEIGERYGKDPNLRQYSFNAARLTQAYNNLIAPHQPRSTLIPPRRRIEEQATIQFGAKADCDGTGLINHLFYCQSQADGTPERNLSTQLTLAFEDISSGFSYRIIPSLNNFVSLQFKSPSGTLVPASQCGQGLQDLIIILFFTLSKQYDLVLLEEPESHLHPEMQRKLLSFLAE